MRKTIPEFELYSVDEQGTVFSNKTGLQLKWLRSAHKPPYPMVNLFKGKGKKGYTKLVHLLVAAAFLPKPPGKEEIHHKDNNHWNPSLTNLVWVTKSENALYGYHEFHTRSSPALKGEDSGRAKLTEVEVNQIRLEHKTGMSYLNLAEKYGITRQHASYICRGKSWKHLLPGGKTTCQCE
jgi:hypothetical protein